MVNSLHGSVSGREGRSYGPRVALCLGPQNFPDAPNHANFPPCGLAPGQTYANRVRYKFGVTQACSP
jgi:aldose 1-epimerase